MNVGELIGYQEADIAEEGVGPRREAIEEVIERRAQSGEIVRAAMQVGEVLAQPPPQFLDGVRPGRVGG